MDENNLTPSDTRHMLHLGQAFGRSLTVGTQLVVLREAANFYILAANAREEGRLRFCWLEGARNYAVGQFQLDEWERRLDLAIWKVSQEEA